MDLITHLFYSYGYNAVFTIMDRFSKYGTLLPCSTNCTAVDLALLFYNNIVCKFAMPVKTFGNLDSRFLSSFW